MRRGAQVKTHLFTALQRLLNLWGLDAMRSTTAKPLGEADPRNSRSYSMNYSKNRRPSKWLACMRLLEIFFGLCGPVYVSIGSGEHFERFVFLLMKIFLLQGIWGSRWSVTDQS